MAEPWRRVPDAGWAFLIGALTGIGAVLLMRAGGDATEEVVRSLRDEGLNAYRASGKRARELDEIVAWSRRIRRPDRS